MSANLALLRLGLMFSHSCHQGHVFPIIKFRTVLCMQYSAIYQGGKSKKKLITSMSKSSIREGRILFVLEASYRSDVTSCLLQQLEASLKFRKFSLRESLPLILTLLLGRRPTRVEKNSY